MKRLTASLLIAFCVLTCFPLSAFAQDVSFTIRVTDAQLSEAEVTGYSGQADIIDIPAMVDGYSIVGIGNEFTVKEAVPVRLPASVRSVERIGNLQAERFQKVTEYTVDENNPYLKSVDGAVYDTAVQTLKLYPSNTAKSEITLPQTVTKIDNYAFAYLGFFAKKYKSVPMHEGLLSVGQYAFSHAYVKQLHFPESVQTIGYFPFYCSRLESVYFGKNAENLASGRFGSTGANALDDLKEITVSEDNPNMVTIDGVLFADGGETLVCYPPEKADKTYKVPAGVKKIACAAFAFAYKIKEIDFNEVEEIEDDAFINNATETLILPACLKTTGQMNGIEPCLKTIICYNPSCKIKMRFYSFDSTSYNITVYGYAGSTAQQFVDNNTQNNVHFTFKFLDDPEHCQHKYQKTVVEPTCTQIGYTHYKCLYCSSNYDEEQTNALGHSEKPVAAVPASCTQSGLTEGAVCERCGITLRQQTIVPAKGHSLDNGVLIRPATCTAYGAERISCKECDYHFEQTLPMLSHTYNEGIVIKQSNCRENGIKRFTCAVCGTYYDESLPVSAHDYASQVIERNSTCTEAGIKRYTCIGCGDSYEEYLPLLSHTYDKGIVVRKSNCTEHGIKRFSCTMCGIYYDESLPVTGHDYASQVIERNSTCSRAGVKRFTCTVCGKSYSEALPLLAHTYDKGKVLRSSNCTQHGVVRYTCTVCSAHKDVSLPLNSEHSYNSGVVIKKSTCNAQGVKRFTCMRCKAIYDKKLPLSAEHRYNTGVLTKKPTCTAKGVTTYTCKVCGAKKAVAVKAKGHSFNNGVITKKSTCTVAGNKRYTCKVCRAVKNVRLAKAAHQYTSVVTKAGFTKNGTIKKYCKVCKGAVTKQTIYKVSSASLNKVTYTYTGSAIGKPGVTLKNSQGQKLASKYYTVTYYSRANGAQVSSIKAIGQYKAKVSLKGNYSGTKYLYFSVGLRAVSLGSVKAGKKSITVKWKADSSVSGYQVMLSENASFSAGVKTAMVNSSSISSCQFVNLKAGKVYYVKMRTFKDIQVDGRSARMYSDYTGSKSAKAK